MHLPSKFLIKFTNLTEILIKLCKKIFVYISPLTGDCCVDTDSLILLRSV